MKKLEYLYGLRGLSAIAVYLSHIIIVIYPALIYGRQSLVHSQWENFIYDRPWSIVFNGAFAVYIFLALTGFLFAYKRDSLKMNINSWMRFIASRWVRIAGPALVSVVGMWLLLAVNYRQHLRIPAITGSDVFNELPLVPNLWQAVSNLLEITVKSADTNYNAALWPLSYFFLGSIIVFALVKFLRWRVLQALVCIAAAVILYDSPFTAIFVGAFVGVVYPQLTRLSAKSTILPWAGLFALILAVIFGAIPPLRGDIRTTYMFWNFPELRWSRLVRVYYAIGAGATLFALFVLPKFQKLLNHRTLQWVGRISFSLYVIHYFVIALVAPLVFEPLAKMLPYDAAGILTFITTTGAVLCVSYYYFQFVEKPFLRWSQQLRGKS